jgi:hypothetical protein
LKALHFPALFPGTLLFIHVEAPRPVDLLHATLKRAVG